MDYRNEKILNINLVTIIDIIDWIESNLHENININTISSKSGYSKWHLQRVFKSITGESLGSYIRTRKLACTAIALQLFEYSILDILTAYNFSSQQSYTRAFNAYYKVTPAKFRREKLSENHHLAIRDEFNNPLLTCCPSLKKAFPLKMLNDTSCQDNIIIQIAKRLSMEDRYH